LLKTGQSHPFLGRLDLCLLLVRCWRLLHTNYKRRCAYCVTQHSCRARKRQHLQNLQAYVLRLERENIRLSQKVTMREAELRQMQKSSSVQREGTLQPHSHQFLTLLCARSLTMCFTLCSDSCSMQLPCHTCHQASASRRQGCLVLSP
jgi:hypothetical protein